MTHYFLTTLMTPVGAGYHLPGGLATSPPLVTLPVATGGGGWSRSISFQGRPCDRGVGDEPFAVRRANVRATTWGVSRCACRRRDVEFSRTGRVIAEWRPTPTVEQAAAAPGSRYPGVSADRASFSGAEQRIQRQGDYLHAGS